MNLTIKFEAMDPYYASTVEVAVDEDEWDFLKYFLDKLNVTGDRGAPVDPIEAYVFDDKGNEITIDGSYEGNSNRGNYST